MHNPSTASAKIMSVFLFFSVVSFFCSASSSAKTAIPDSVNLLIIDGKLKEAIPELKRIVAHDSTNAAAFAKLGFCYQSLFQHDSALAPLETANKIEPENPHILMLLAQSYNFLGSVNQAENAYERVFARDSTNLRAGISLGKIYLENGKYAKADSVYHILTGLDSTNSYLYKQLGVCALKKDSAELAVRYFQRSLSLNPKEINVILQLSFLHYSRNELDSALQVVQRGLTLFPENSHLIKQEAEIFFKKKRYKKAIADFEKVVKTENASALIYKKLGICYFFEKEKTFALLNLLESYKRDSSDALTCYYIGLAYKDHNLHEKAILYLKKAIKRIIPDYMSEIYTQLASSQDHEKQFPAAIRSFRKALEYQPSKKLLSFYLGSVYDQYYEDRRVPLLYYQKFLRENPEADAKLKKYANERIKALRQELHFHKRGK